MKSEGEQDMTFKKRTLAVLVAVLMVFAMMPMQAQAASTAAVYMKVTQNNAKAKQILKYVNKERTKRGLKKLKLDKSLTNAAVTRAAEVSILVPSTSPHKRPNGKVARTVNKRINYECCLEAEGYGPKAMVHSWMTSKSHKKGILLKSAKSIGISYVTTVDGYQIATLEISNTKAKSILKSNAKKTVTKKASAKRSLIKKNYFKIRNASTMTAGKTSKAKVIYNGPKAYGPGLVAPKSFRWTSSNTAVATVSSSGTIKARKAGTVTIRAKLKSGSKFTITKKITVKKPANSTSGGTTTYEQSVLKKRQQLFDYTVANGTRRETSGGTVYYATESGYGSYSTSTDDSGRKTKREMVIYTIAYPGDNELRLAYYYECKWSDDNWATETVVEHDSAWVALYTDDLDTTTSCGFIIKDGNQNDVENYEHYQVRALIDRSRYDADWNDENMSLMNVTIYSGEEWLDETSCKNHAFSTLDDAFGKWDEWLSTWTKISGMTMYSLGFPAMPH